MKLYHGTNSEFKTFDLSMSGVSHGAFLGRGIYLTSSRTDAKSYGTIVYEVDVDISNLLDLRNLQNQQVAANLPNLRMKDGNSWKAAFDRKKDIKNKIQKVNCQDSGGWCDLQWKFEGEWHHVPRQSTMFTKGHEKEIAAVKTMRKLGYDDPDNIGHFGRYFGSEFAKAVVAAGFDGVIHHGTNIGDRGDEYVIMNPRVIKNLIKEGRLRQYIRQILLEEQKENPTPLPEPIMKAIQDYSKKSVEACGIPQEYDYWAAGGKLHPHAGKCRGSARGLARAIDTAAGKKVSRMVGGWFRSASDDYYYPRNGYQTYPPRELRKPGENWEEHWWVEVMGWYVDVTANQFFPKDVTKQKEHELVITPANFEKYYPHRRRPLRKSKKLSPDLEKLAKKIQSLKKARKWNKNPYDALTWLKKQGLKFGLTNSQATNLTAMLRHEDVDVDFSDIEQVRDLIREVL